LTKITYPTGGYTYFEYEAPKVLMKDPAAYRAVSLEAYCSYKGLIPDTRLCDNKSIGPEIDEEGNVSSPPSQTININVNVTSNANVNHHYRIYLKVQDVIESTEDVSYFVLAPDITSYSRAFSFNLLEDHLYNIKLEIEPDPESQMDPCFVYAEATFGYSVNDNLIPGDGLGIRIKRLLDYSSIISTPIIKRYYYTSAENINNDNFGTTPPFNTKKYAYCTNHTIQCESYENASGNIGYINYYTIAHLQSTTLNFLFPTTEDFNPYQNVTISYGDDNFKLGGIQKDFKIIGSGYPTTIIFDENLNTAPKSLFEYYRDNYDMYNSILRKETVFKNLNSSLYKIKETEYDYSISEKYCPNTIIKRAVEVIDYTPPTYRTLVGLYIGYFRTYSLKLYLNRIITKDYIDPVPFIGKVDESSYKKIVSVTQMKYSGCVGLPTETYNIINNNEKVIKAKVYYPFNASCLDLESSDCNNYSRMFISHMLSIPTQTEKFVSYYGSLPEIDELGDSIITDSIDNQLLYKKLSTQRTVFGSNLLPKKIQMSFEENPLEDKVYCNYYDNKGNPLEIVKKDDISTIYIWGYKQTQPIAKIENASYSKVYIENSQIIGSLQTLSDKDINQTTENILKNSLNALRDLFPEAMITTYTYDLPYGVSSITDLNGRTTYYLYDGFGRLKEVRDHDNNIIKQTEYHYGD